MFFCGELAFLNSNSIFCELFFFVWRQLVCSHSRSIKREFCQYPNAYVSYPLFVICYWSCFSSIINRSSITASHCTYNCLARPSFFTISWPRYLSLEEYAIFNIKTFGRLYFILKHLFGSVTFLRCMNSYPIAIIRVKLRLLLFLGAFGVTSLVFVKLKLLPFD